MAGIDDVDWRSYAGWEKKVAPTGQVYYKVPGTGYLYDPFTNRLYSDPSIKLKEQEDLKKAEEKKNSVGGQIGPWAAGVGGVVAAKHVVDFLEPERIIDAKLTNKGVGTITNKGTLGGALADKAPVSTAPTPTTEPLAPMTAPAQTPQQAFIQNATPNTSPTGVAPGGQALPGIEESMTTVTAPVPISSPGADGSVWMSDGTLAYPGAANGLSQPEIVSVQAVPETSWAADAAPYVQGAAGAFNIYQGMQDYKEGDYTGAAVNAGTGGVMVAESVSPGVTGVAGTWAGPIAGAYGAYENAEYVGAAPAGGKRNSMSTAQGAAAGAAMGAPWAGATMGLSVVGGALIGGAIGFLGSYYGSSKDKYQMARDGVREYWKEKGLLDERWHGTLADGSTFDFGKDGKEAGKLDESDPNWGEYAAFANLIAAGEGLTGKAGEATATLFTNAASSNTGGNRDIGMSNLSHFANQRGFHSGNVKIQIQKLKDEEKITDEQYAAWTADADKFLPQPPAGWTPEQELPQQVEASLQEEGKKPEPVGVPKPGTTVATAPAATPPPAPGLEKPVKGQPIKVLKGGTTAVTPAVPGGTLSQIQMARELASRMPGGATPVVTPQMQAVGFKPVQGVVTPSPWRPGDPTGGMPVGTTGWTPNRQLPVDQSLVSYAPGAYAPPAAVVPVTSTAAVLPVAQPQRTMTLSPGIGLDGKPLSPQQMGQMVAQRMNARR